MQLFFEAFWGTELVSRVWIVQKGRYKVDRISKSPIKQIFARENLTEAELCDVLKDRCWDEDRPDLSRILEVFGLTEFNPIELVKRTHGKSCNDPLHFRFADEIESE
ncbi:MAG: hypothetical protein K2G45_09530 [Lachnospiraceae bacterium]|nr:hypothetical protein [Lachnospiraceae bacterium]